MRHTLLSKGPRIRRRRKGRFWGWLGGGVIVAGIAAYWYLVFAVVDSPHQRYAQPISANTADTSGETPNADALKPVSPSAVVQSSILETAKGMLRRGVRWESGYTVISYPGGDVPADRGTSVDILIRALRGADIDLQRLLHEDRVAHPERYPLQRWKQQAPDTNIDHRRLANVWVFFNRYAERLDASVNTAALEAYRPGDVVFWSEGKMDVPLHVGIVDDRRDASGAPFVIELHQDEGRISDQHRLTDWPVMGHFRVDIDRLPRPGQWEAERPAETEPAKESP